MSISTVVTRGYGSFAGVSFICVRGYEQGSTPPPVTIDTHDGATIKRHHERLKRQAKLAEERIYRDAPKLGKPTLPIDVPQEDKPQERPVLTLRETLPEAYGMAALPLADPMQWLYDDDEEAILWLMQ